MKYSVHGHTFPNKLTLTTYVRQLVDTEQSERLKDVLCWHPRLSEKLAELGVAHLHQVTLEYGCNRAVFLSYGTARVDISWRKCLPRRVPQQPDVRPAMRHAVHKDIERYRNHAPAVCALCHTVPATIHVDHCGSQEFRHLAEAFLRTHEVPAVRDLPQGGQTLVDPGPWQKFHAEHAQLQILCAACNLHKPRSQPREHDKV